MVRAANVRRLSGIILCFVSSLLALLLMGCPAKPEKDMGPDIRVYEMGDPLNIIRGATLEQDFTKGEFFEDGESMQIVSSFIFQERITARRVKKKPAKKDSHTHGDGENRKELVKIGYDRASKYLSLDLDSQKVVVTTFPGKFGPKVQLKDLNGGIIPGELLHFSANKEAKMVSLLILFGDSGHKLIQQLVLSKNLGPAQFQNNKSKFQFLPGGQFRAPLAARNGIWLQVCGIEDPRLIQDIRDSAKQWNQHLPQYAQVQVVIPDTYPPHSDLNTMCVYSVQDFLKETRPNVGRLGETLVVFDHGRGVIHDADVFLLESEFKKFPVPMMSEIRRQEREWVILHELGHLLGLDHQFDGTPSIMSYEEQGPTLKLYDIQAIQELYPEKP
jgi:hypothetical protein